MKRIKSAVAIGTAAMTVLGLSGVGLAQDVQTQGNVTSLVDSVANNVDKTQVVLGSAADISDGQQAARIAATLVNQNYVQASAEDFELSGGTGNATGTATVERTGEAEYEISGNTYTEEYTSDGSATDYDTGAGVDSVLTTTQLPDILSYQEIEDLEVGGEDTDFTFEEELEINGGYAKYDESDDEPSAHGLYWGNSDITWRLDLAAGGQGLPLGKGNYTDTEPSGELPEFDMLGSTYVLDIGEFGNDNKLQEDEIVLFPASSRPTLKLGESTEISGWTVTLDDLKLGGDDAAIGAMVTAEKGNYSETMTIDDYTGEEFESGDDSVSVYVDDTYETSAGNAIAELMLGSGEVDLTEDTDDPFPLDDRWVLSDKSNWISGNYLEKIQLEYGNSDKEDWLEIGDFDATAPYDDDGGLPVGEPVTGPETEDAESNFQAEFKGFGSAEGIDTTEVKLDMNDGEILNAEYTDRAGQLNIFEPSNADDANMTTKTDGWKTGTTPDNISAVVLEEDQYTVIDNKVVYLNDVKDKDGVQYEVEFLVNSDDGKSITEITNSFDSGSHTPAGQSVGTSFTLDQGGEALDFTATVDNYTDKVYIKGDTIADPSTSRFHVQLGDQAVMSSGTPTLDLSGAYNATATAASEEVEALLTDGGSGDKVYASYDADADDEGIKAGSSSFGDTDYIDYQQNDVNTTDKYHITGTGIEITDTGTEKATVYLPEKDRSTLLKVSGIDEGGEEGMTVSEGDEFGNWKLTSLDIQGTGEGAIGNADEFYDTQKTVTTPQDLITMDGSATAQYQVVVGGPSVNSVADGMSGASDLTTQGNAVLAEDGNKLLAAGYSATDTANAADELITLLTA